MKQQFKQTKARMNVKVELENLLLSLLLAAVTAVLVAAADGPDWACLGFALVVFIVRFR